MLPTEVVELILVHLPVKASSLNNGYYLKYKRLRRDEAITNGIRLQEVRDMIQQEGTEDDVTGLFKLTIGAWSKEMNKFYLGPCYASPLPSVYKHFSGKDDSRIATTYTDLKELRKLLDCEPELDYYDMHTESLVIERRLRLMGMFFNCVEWKKEKLAGLNVKIKSLPEMLRLKCMLYPLNVYNRCCADLSDVNLKGASKREIIWLQEEYNALVMKYSRQTQ